MNRSNPLTLAAAASGLLCAVLAGVSAPSLSQTAEQRGPVIGDNAATESRKAVLRRNSGREIKRMSRRTEATIIAKGTVRKGATAALIAPGPGMPALTGAAVGAETTLRQEDLKPVILEGGAPGVRIGTAEYREGPRP